MALFINSIATLSFTKNGATIAQNHYVNGQLVKSLSLADHENFIKGAIFFEALSEEIGATYQNVNMAYHENWLWEPCPATECPSMPSTLIENQSDPSLSNMLQ